MFNMGFCPWDSGLFSFCVIEVFVRIFAPDELRDILCHVLGIVITTWERGGAFEVLMVHDEPQRGKHGQIERPPSTRTGRSL